MPTRAAWTRCSAPGTPSTERWPASRSRTSWTVGSHPWARADRIAWGEETGPADPLLEQLHDAYRPIDLPSQLIHGDLLGNVLFASGRPPAIIDWAPYWRPADYAAAIAVADAACWHGYPLERLRADGGTVEWRQLLLRALVFRIATFLLVGNWSEDLRRRHEPVVRAVLALEPRH